MPRMMWNMNTKMAIIAPIFDEYLKKKRKND